MTKDTKRNPLKGNETLLGSYMPNSLVDYVSLFAVHGHKTRSSVLRDIVQEWKTTKPVQTMLITDLSDRAWAEWEKRVSEGVCKSNKKDWLGFINEIHDALIKRKVSAIHVEAIIEGLKKYTNEVKNGTNHTK